MMDDKTQQKLEIKSLIIQDPVVLKMGLLLCCARFPGLVTLRLLEGQGLKGSGL